MSEDLLPKNISPYEALKVIWLGDYFKISELVFIMIETFLVPQIDAENVIQLINEAYSKLKSIGRNGFLRQNSQLSLPELTTSSSIIFK